MNVFDYASNKNFAMEEIYMFSVSGWYTTMRDTINAACFYDQALDLNKYNEELAARLFVFC